MKQIIAFLSIPLLVVLLIFGGDFAAFRLAQEVRPIFVKFNEVTTKRYPKESERSAEMRKLVAEAETKAKEVWLYSCDVSMVAHNPRTIYRVDRLKVNCSIAGVLFGNPQAKYAVVEYKHKHP